MESCFSQIAEELELAFKLSDNPLDRLYNVLLAFVRYGTQFPNQYRMAMLVRPYEDESDEHIPVESAIRTRTIVRKAVRLALREGHIQTSSSIDVIVQSLLCMVQGVITSIITLKRIDLNSADFLAQHIFTCYISGLSRK
jgi:hypothetical protein